MKRTVLRYKILIIVFSSLFIPLMFISLFRIEYSFLAPGFNDNISEFIVVNEEYNPSGSFHTTSVISLDKITILQFIVGALENKVTVDEFPDYYQNVDLDDLNVMSYLMKDDSLASSLIIGIDRSGFEIDYDSYLSVYLVYNYLTADSLKLGDKILEVNGRTDLVDAFNNIACNETVEFMILRKDEEMTVYADNSLRDNGTCSIGIYLSYISEINSTVVDYTLVDTDTGGPSGGLMQSVYIYNQLTELNLGLGLKIAGTGTISVDGSVGAIGGIRQKILTADINNIDVFFVPYLSDDESDNYKEALRTYNALDTSMVLVGVSSFQEVIDYLLALESGDGNE